MYCPRLRSSRARKPCGFQDPTWNPYHGQLALQKASDWEAPGPAARGVLTGFFFDLVHFCHQGDFLVNDAGEKENKNKSKGCLIKDELLISTGSKRKIIFIKRNANHHNYFPVTTPAAHSAFLRCGNVEGTRPRMTRGHLLIESLSARLEKGLSDLQKAQL